MRSLLERYIEILLFENMGRLASSQARRIRYIQDAIKKTKSPATRASLEKQLRTLSTVDGFRTKAEQNRIAMIMCKATQNS